MKILHKYVLKEHLGPFVFAFSALTSILLLQTVAKQFGNLVGKGLPWTVIAEFFGLSLPYTLALTLPMAVLVSTLYAFSRLAAENEITALKASGVGMPRILVPVLVAALGATLVMLCFNDQILPRTNHQLASLMSDIAQTKPTFALREQVINEVTPGKLYLRANHISQSRLMREVTIYDMTDATRRRTIIADSGTIGMAPNRADLLMTLYSGVMQDVPTGNPAQLQRLFFQSDLIRVKGVANQFQKSAATESRGPREQSICQMQTDVDTATKSYLQARESFLQNLEMAKVYKIKLAPEAYTTKTPVPPRVTLGGLYCTLLKRLGVPELQAQLGGTQTPPAQKPVAQKPVTQQPVAQQPATQQPPVSQPPAPKPVQTPMPRPPVPQPIVRIPTPQVSSSTQVARPPVARPSAPRPPVIKPPIVKPPVGRPPVIPPELRARLTFKDGVPSLAAPPYMTPMVIESSRVRLMDAVSRIDLIDVEIHKKFALAVACFVFVLLGAPIALRFPRGGVGLTIGVSLLVFAIYYIGLIAGASLGSRGIVRPWIAMWSTNVIFGIIGLILVSRMGKEGGTSRGGDTSELRDTLKRWLWNGLHHVGLARNRRVAA